MIDQTQSGDAIANAPQNSVLDQSDDVVGGTDPAPVPDATDGAVTAGDLSTSGNLLDVNLNVDADVDAAAPIDAAVAANIGSISWW